MASTTAATTTREWDSEAGGGVLAGVLESDCIARQNSMRASAAKSDAGADGAVGESFAPQAVPLSADSQNMRRASVSRILEPDQGLERLESTCEAFSFPFWSSVQP
jgi:hypothetical protein